MKQKVSTMERFPPARTGRRPRSAKGHAGPGPSRLDLPHERDERLGMTDGISSDVVEQGGRDLAAGLVDTDKAAQMDSLYRRVRRQPRETTCAGRRTAAANRR